MTAPCCPVWLLAVETLLEEAGGPSGLLLVLSPPGSDSGLSPARAGIPKQRAGLPLGPRTSAPFTQASFPAEHKEQRGLCFGPHKGSVKKNNCEKKDCVIRTQSWFLCESGVLISILHGDHEAAMR